MQLLITLDDWEGNRVGLYVNEFRISNAIGEYRILYSNFSSALGMSLPPIGTKFSTFDKDNDGWEKNCAEKFSGAWCRFYQLLFPLTVSKSQTVYCFNQIS